MGEAGKRKYWLGRTVQLGSSQKVCHRRQWKRISMQVNHRASPACNCKPNWPEHTFHNPHGNLCDCGNDPMKKYIYRMTKDGNLFDQTNFQNWEPHPGWSIAGWNFLGFSKMKRELKSVEVATVQAKRKISSEGFETKVRCAATPA